MTACAARLLVVNAGSSSLKLTLLGGSDETLAARELAAPRAELDPVALESALADGLAEADAVGHRVAHGGPEFSGAVLIDADVRRQLEELVDLAPLHQPKSLAGIDAVSRALPEAPAVACFDTAFHTTLAPAAATYALPAAWRKRWRLRRYGFHGLSHGWVARHVPEFLGRTDEQLRIVSCHLGAGASLCAIGAGASRDTTMGFTPLEGLVMATRSGSVDPGLLLWLLERSDMSELELASALEHESGLLGLAGSGDMRKVLADAAAGDADAELAVEVYVHRLRGAIATMAAALGDVDVLVFTGGVGERSAEIRARAVSCLGFLGLAVDEERNTAALPDADVSATGVARRVLVIRAREDLEIARQARAVI